MFIGHYLCCQGCRLASSCPPWTRGRAWPCPRGCCWSCCRGGTRSCPPGSRSPSRPRSPGSPSPGWPAWCHRLSLTAAPPWSLCSPGSSWLSSPSCDITACLRLSRHVATVSIWSQLRPGSQGSVPGPILLPGHGGTVQVYSRQSDNRHRNRPSTDNSDPRVSGRGPIVRVIFSCFAVADWKTLRLRYDCIMRPHPSHPFLSLKNFWCHS